MKTTLELDRELLERARSLLGTPSFTATIEAALREVVHRGETAAAWREILGSHLSWQDVEDLVSYRRRYGGRSL